MAQGYSSSFGNIVITGKPCEENTSSIALNSSMGYTGTGVDVSAYPSITVAAKTDQNGILYIEFSPDNSNWDSSLSYVVTANINEVHRLSVTRQYFRVRFTNTSASNQSYFRLQSLLGSQPPLTSTLNSTIQSDADALITRSVLVGSTDGGNFKNVPVTPEGHLEVALHSPRLPFGSVHTENLTPMFQADGVYTLNPALTDVVTGGTGSVVIENSMMKVSTGTGIGGYGVLQSLKRLRYRPGQGLVGRFAGFFNNTGVTNSVQVIGFGHAEDGFYFGYSGTSFGILYNHHGVREIRTLNITTASNTNQNALVRLNGVDFAVPVTNSNNAFRTAYEIASYSAYTGWNAVQSGSSIIFLANDVGLKSSTFEFTGTTAVGSFTRNLSGAAVTNVWIPQTSWNGDKLDGNGDSGVLLDPTKGNVYQIGIQYLGFGAIVFAVETVSENANNPDFVVVHTLRIPNTNILTTVSNPAFPFLATAYSMGSTTNLSIYVGSFGGFLEGQKRLTGPRFTYNATSTSVNTTTLTALMSIQNSRVFANRANQAVVNLLSIGCAVKQGGGTPGPVTISIIKNATLAGNVNFTSYSTQSVTLFDTAATTATYTDNSQIIYSMIISDAGGEMIFAFEDEVTLEPGETITIVAKSAAVSPPYVVVSLNTREDQ